MSALGEQLRQANRSELSIFGRQLGNLRHDEVAKNLRPETGESGQRYQSHEGEYYPLWLDAFEHLDGKVWCQALHVDGADK